MNRGARVRGTRGARLAALAALLVAFALAGPLAPVARAQSAPQIQVQADAQVVGVGDVLRIEMTATSADAMPSDPRPGATPGFILRGQNASPSQTHISINGNRMDRYSLTVDWALQAQRVGTFSLGPPTVVVGSTRYQTPSITVRVVPAGQAPAPPPRRPRPSPFSFGMSPFDPWKGLIQIGPPDTEPPTQPEVNVDPRLSVEPPRGAAYFLHATVDRTSAVVGEQVTYSLYEYVDLGAPNVQVDEESVHDPAMPDFVRRPLLQNDQSPGLSGYAASGGRTWAVKLVRRWAIFPLRAGDLVIGAMDVGLLSPRGVAGQKRSSEQLTVHVSEPPLAGRPPGYTTGDVGQFAVSAQVDPRQVDQDGAVGVHVEVTGTGNVPSSIAAPVRDGVEWLAPEVHEQLGPAGGETFGGKRSFDYVVRLHRPGAVDLGEIALPFWNPRLRRYEVARAALGAVQVRPAAVAAPGSSMGPAAGAASGAGSALPPEQPLQGLPAARPALEGLRPARGHVDDNPLFWLFGIAAWPAALGAAVTLRAAALRIARAWRERKASPATELRERVVAARAASGGGDPRAADAATARALEAAALALAGVNIRGALGGEVAARLERAGVVHDAASQVAELLRECEAARFAPEGADVAAARDRWARAQGAIRQMEKRA